MEKYGTRAEKRNQLLNKQNNRIWCEVSISNQQFPNNDYNPQVIEKITFSSNKAKRENNKASEGYTQPQKDQLQESNSTDFRSYGHFGNFGKTFGQNFRQSLSNDYLHSRPEHSRKAHSRSFESPENFHHQSLIKILRKSMNKQFSKNSKSKPTSKRLLGLKSSLKIHKIQNCQNTQSWDFSQAKSHWMNLREFAKQKAQLDNSIISAFGNDYLANIDSSPEMVQRRGERLRTGFGHKRNSAQVGVSLRKAHRSIVVHKNNKSRSDQKFVKKKVLHDKFSNLTTYGVFNNFDQDKTLETIQTVQKSENKTISNVSESSDESGDPHKVYSKNPLYQSKDSPGLVSTGTITQTQSKKPDKSCFKPKSDQKPSPYPKKPFRRYSIDPMLVLSRIEKSPRKTIALSKPILKRSPGQICKRKLNFGNPLSFRKLDKQNVLRGNILKVQHHKLEFTEKSNPKQF